MHPTLLSWVQQKRWDAHTTKIGTPRHRPNSYPFFPSLFYTLVGELFLKFMFDEVIPPSLNPSMHSPTFRIKSKLYSLIMGPLSSFLTLSPTSALTPWPFNYSLSGSPLPGSSHHLFLVTPISPFPSLPQQLPQRLPPPSCISRLHSTS